MPKVSVPKLAMRPPHRLLLIFASTILVPGILLAFFGLRALVQESRLVDQQIRERLQGAGQTAARRLERELSEWQQAIFQLGQSGATDPALWPARVRLATQQPGSAVVLLGEKDRVQAFPPGQLPYILPPAPAPSSSESCPMQDEPAPSCVCQSGHARRLGPRPSWPSYARKTMKRP